MDAADCLTNLVARAESGIITYKETNRLPMEAGSHLVGEKGLEPLTSAM